MFSPENRFVWAFRGIEFNGFPIAFPVGVLQQFSTHLSKCGFVHIDEVRAVSPEVADKLPQQVIHYQPPVRGQDHYLNTAGKWVPVEEELITPVVDELDSLTPSEKAVLIGRFKEEGLL